MWNPPSSMKGNECDLPVTCLLKKRNAPCTTIKVDTRRVYFHFQQFNQILKNPTARFKLSTTARS
jgi:hypothetical protein